jgi:hypothetical protein
MSRSTNLLIALAGLHNHGSFYGQHPKAKPKVVTQADLDRLQKAKEKRLMKEQKRLVHK